MTWLKTSTWRPFNSRAFTTVFFTLQYQVVAPRGATKYLRREPVSRSATTSSIVARRAAGVHDRPMSVSRCSNGINDILSRSFCFFFRRSLSFNAHSWVYFFHGAPLVAFRRRRRFGFGVVESYSPSNVASSLTRSASLFDARLFPFCASRAFSRAMICRASSS